MAFDQLKTEIMMLFTEMENQPEDKQECPAFLKVDNPGSFDETRTAEEIL